MRPNILLITADQWRGDCLGAVGHPTVRTPNLDRFAETATVFERHYATTAPCSPARASLYTGLYQMNHRVIWNGAPLDDRFDNIAKAGCRAGYVPTLFGYTDTAPDPRVHDPHDPALQTYEGVLPGFTLGQALPEDGAPWKAWLASRGYDLQQLETIHNVAPQHGHKVSLEPTVYGANETETAFLANAFLEWLGRQASDTPWFAHLSFISPHPPLTQPAPYHAFYDPAAGPPFRGPGTLEAAAGLHPLSRAILEHRKLSSHFPGGEGLVKDLHPLDFMRLRALYYGAISEVDAQLGRLFAALDAGGMSADTVVIFTSDHAEMMGDYHMVGKGGIFEESYHIPLIIRMPGGVTGNRVHAFTSAADIFPTLLDIWGLAPDHVPDGCSLKSYLSGQTPVRWRQSALWEYDFRNLEVQPQNLTPGAEPRDKSVMCHRSEDHLYIHSPALPDALFGYAPDGSLTPIDTASGAGMAQLSKARGELLAERVRLADNTLAQKLVWDHAASRMASSPACRD
ncbi:sulfatase [Roseibium aquae]|uniref:Sulfatase n=1 Tax=Roseibium aquae TaxID=1323746 RepID=A0A916X1G7_9HYPH|nr:sulfatase-like hydrolase/transferase [Roseibium aquae]GGB46975.1 sulfatase [Roseibium aquae]